MHFAGLWREEAGSMPRGLATSLDHFIYFSLFDFDRLNINVWQFLLVIGGAVFVLESYD